jgi:hypothetical protein
MKEVRGGPPNTVRTRGDKIAAASTIAPVISKRESSPQGVQGHPRLVRTTGPSLRETRSAELRRLRRQRYAKRIWPLGERVEFQLVEHLITAFDLDEDAVDRVLDRFAELDSEVLKMLGADRLPPSPTREVQR